MSSTLIVSTPSIFGQSVKDDPFITLPPESTNDALNYLKKEHFEVFLNGYFQFQPSEGRSFRLQLVEVAGLENDNNIKRGLRGDSFSLLFQNNSKVKIAERTFIVSHESLGSFTLMISPVGLRGNRYEAIINRINLP